ncbi:MAG: hypothetical protein JWM55_223 [Acidimicrobiaceae bacterium]|nr:hypothetical protein [Acidimicrobiaceae bacterium]
MNIAYFLNWALTGAGAGAGWILMRWAVTGKRTGETQLARDLANAVRKVRRNDLD